MLRRRFSSTISPSGIASSTSIFSAVSCYSLSFAQCHGSQQKRPALRVTVSRVKSPSSPPADVAATAKANPHLRKQTSSINNFISRKRRETDALHQKLVDALGADVQKKKTVVDAKKENIGEEGEIDDEFAPPKPSAVESKLREKEITAFNQQLATAASETFPQTQRALPAKFYSGPKLLPYQENALAWMIDREQYKFIEFPAPPVEQQRQESKGAGRRKKSKKKPQQKDNAMESGADAASSTSSSSSSSSPADADTFFWEKEEAECIGSLVIKPALYRHSVTGIERPTPPVWPRGGILSLSMGLGKTVVAITLFSHSVSFPPADFFPKAQRAERLAEINALRQQPSLNLVVCPMSLLDHWRQHVMDSLPGFGVMVLHLESLLRDVSLRDKNQTIDKYLAPLRHVIQQRKKAQRGIIIDNNNNSSGGGFGGGGLKGVVVITTYSMVGIASRNASHPFHSILFPSSDSGNTTKQQQQPGGQLKNESNKRISKQDVQDQLLTSLGLEVEESDGEIQIYDANSTSSLGEAPHIGHKALSCAWDRVILDEAQHIKNQSSRTFQSALALSAATKWCLSGTPLQNSLGDLHALVRFLDVDVWRTKTLFNTCIQERLAGQRLEGAQRLRKLMARVCLRRQMDDLFDGKPLLTLPPLKVHIERISMSSAEQETYRAVERRASSDFDALLRAALRTVELAQQRGMKPQEVDRAAARAMGKVDAELLDPKNVNRIFLSGLLLLLRLRQAANDTRLVRHYSSAAAAAAAGGGGGDDLIVGTSSSSTVQNEAVAVQKALAASEQTVDEVFEDADELEETVMEAQLSAASSSQSSASSTAAAAAALPFDFTLPPSPGLPLPPETMGSKCKFIVKFVREMLARDPTEKCVVFSQWPPMLQLVQEALSACGVSSSVFCGRHTHQERQRILHQFNNDDRGPTVLLISLMAGGTGLNLSRANNCILSAPWWNPAVDYQAMMRVHRIGQKRAVNVVRLIVRDTIEERIERLQQQKQSLADVAGVGRRVDGGGSSSTAAASFAGSTTGNVGLTLKELRMLMSLK